MATKTTGAEFKAFYRDKTFWPKDAWHEEEEITIDGAAPPFGFDLDSVPDNANLVLANGYVSNENGDELGSFEGYFRKWRNKQTTKFLAVEVPNEKINEVKDAIIEAGGKVIG